MDRFRIGLSNTKGTRNELRERQFASVGRSLGTPSGSYLGDDGVLIDYETAGIKSLKVLSEGKFSFVTTANGAFYAAGGGDYTAENGKYARDAASGVARQHARSTL